MTLAGVLLLAGCAGPAVVAPPGAPGAPAGSVAPAAPALRTLVRSELFFGLSWPDGTLIAEQEWRAFLAEHVTPRFPDGLTVLDAAGQYRDASARIIREPSRLVVLIHAPGPGPVAAIEEIRALYRRLFDQESVLLIRTTVEVAF